MLFVLVLLSIYCFLTDFLTLNVVAEFEILIVFKSVITFVLLVLMLKVFPFNSFLCLNRMVVHWILKQFYFLLEVFWSLVNLFCGLFLMFSVEKAWNLSSMFRVLSRHQRKLETFISKCFYASPLILDFLNWTTWENVDYTWGLATSNTHSI